MQVFKNKWFTCFARQEDIENASLCEAIRRAGRGLIDVDLGGGLIKQRVARQSEGRSGGYRTIIVYRAGADVFFIHGFAKNELDNVSTSDLRGLKEAASVYLQMNNVTLAALVKEGRLVEVKCDV